MGNVTVSGIKRIITILKQTKQIIIIVLKSMAQHDFGLDNILKIILLLFYSRSSCCHRYLNPFLI